MEADKNHFQSAKMTLRKAISKKTKPHFQDKIKKTADNSKELWKALKSLKITSSKVYQSKVTLKKDGVIQFEPTKIEKFF